MASSLGFAQTNREEETEWQRQQRQKKDVEQAMEAADPLYKYLHPFKKTSQYGPVGSEVIKAKLIVVDTRDQERCSEIERQIRNSGISEARQSQGSLCERSQGGSPYNSVTIYEKVDANAIGYELNLSKLTNTDHNLFNETRNLGLVAAGVAGLLYVLPESFSKWDKSKNSGGLVQQYKDHVSSPPVRDKDGWAVNYIGHPISGAAYYQVARNLGFSRMESFGYSVLMSTFFWEYGVEAIMEKPSIQDLWSTPVLGSILGEVFFQLSQHIEQQNGEVMGSKKLGSVLMVVLNPAGAISNQINEILGGRVIRTSKTTIYLKQNSCENLPPIMYGDACGRANLNIKIEFKF